MMNITPLIDSTPLIGDGEAIRRRYEVDGVLFLRGVIDPKLLGWAQEKYRSALADEGLIDPAVEPPVWTGKVTKTCGPAT